MTIFAYLAFSIASAAAFYPAAASAGEPASPQAGLLPKGFYVGASTGFSSGRMEQTATGGSAQGLATYGASPIVKIGYEAHIAPKWFVGTFGEIGIGHGNDFYYAGGRTIVSTLRQSAVRSLGARVGFHPNAVQSWYITSGASWANFALDIVAPNPILPGATHRTLGGVFFGIGTETELGHGLWLTQEFRHTRFDEAGLFTLGSTTFMEQPSEAVFRLGLNYRSHHEGPMARSEAANWGGFYAGAGASITTFVSDVQAPDASRDTVRVAQADRGAYVQAGLDLVLHAHWLAGLFVDYSIAKLTASDYLRGEITDRPRWAFGARVGYLQGKAVVYVTGGYALHDLTVRSANFGPLSAPKQAATNGLFVGGGTETRLNDRVSLKFEYRYETLEKRELEFDGFPQVTTSNGHAQSVRLGVAYHF